MYGFWCERPMPPEHEPLLDDIATIVGSGSVMDESFLERADDVHVIIASSTTAYNREFVSQVPNLRVIARTGIGIDNIVLADMTQRGVAVVNTPDAPSVSTAEHAILLIMAVTKHLRRVENVLANGERRSFFSEHNGEELAGLRLGVIGLGRIGRQVARYGSGLGMRVSGYDPFVTPAQIAELGIAVMDDLESMLSISDVVTLHIPALPETYHLMNKERFALMKPGAYIINTARGTLIDEAALLDALERGHLHGAGLDVFDPEPPYPDNPLLHRDDVLATPHIGGVTVASKSRLWSEAIIQSIQVLRGERPPNLCNAEVWSKLGGT